MSYESRDVSTAQGAPYYLYIIKINGTTYRYTSAFERVMHGLEWYFPTPITHGEVRLSRELVKNKLQVSLPLDNPIAQTYLNNPPESVVSILIMRGHYDELDPIVVWKGRVTSSAPDGNALNLECMPISYALNRPGLRMRFQRQCIHAVYEPTTCKLDKEDMKMVGTATAVSINTVTVTGAEAFNNGYFAGGMLRAPDNTYRFIRSHSGNAITLVRPINSLTEAVATNGDTPVTIYPGCDKSRETCKDRFNNLNNYLGFDWIPTVNPFGGSSIL